MKTKNDPLVVKLKTFYGINNIKQLNEVKFPYETDGIVFTPVNAPIQVGTHESMFKWKPRDQNTVDFQVKKRSKGWGLYIQEKGVLVFESEYNEDHELLSEDVIVECQYITSDQTPWWKPIKIRKDKNYPNNRRTFYRTIHNISENIKLSEFEH